jgi:hypothetical protein
VNTRPQAVSAEPIERSHPLLFISHRHDDRAIADVIREFVTNRSGGRIAVYQSSSGEAQAPKIGRNVNQELVKALWKTDLLVLIYTSKAQDWDYCMWECGVATHPQSDDARVIVLQCGRQLPPVLADKIAVDVLSREKVQRFVNEFLTDPGFFPSAGEPVSGFQTNDENVKRAADELYEELLKVVPQESNDQVEEWPAVPFVRLGLAAAQVLEIADEEDEAEARRLTSKLLLDATVLKADTEAAGLFGRPSLPVNESFGKILPAAARKGEPPAWLMSLAAQVMRAAQWNFPSVAWGLMRSANENDSTWYGPVLTHVRRFPTKAMEFEIHFQRFACENGGDAIRLALPKSVAGEAPAGTPSG